jgi:transmembrane sensor
MSTPSHQALPEEIRLVAAQWTIRRDRGLSSTESIDYELWLAADPRHAAAMPRSSSAWSLLDRIPENVAAPVLANATRRRCFWRRSFVIGSLAAAAALALAAIRFARPSALAPSPVANAQAVAASAGPRQLMLSDGTVVQLNTGGEVIEQFTSAERRVLLARGEAHFAVTKNPARPFVVRARNLEVRAVGTAFNVNLQSAVVDVLVTEGVVELQQAVGPALVAEPSRGERDTQNGMPTSGRPTTLIANQLAVVSLAPISHASTTSSASPAPATVVVVTTATAEEIARTLAWQAPLLRLGGATLAELVLEFQRRSGQRVILADPALASLRVGGRFRADDLDGFTHLLATTLDLEVDHAADGTLVLRKKSSPSR